MKKILGTFMAHSVVTRSGKGGTYFGATGCGKTYMVKMNLAIHKIN